MMTASKRHFELVCLQMKLFSAVWEPRFGSVTLSDVIPVALAKWV